MVLLLVDAEQFAKRIQLVVCKSFEPTGAWPGEVLSEPVWACVVVVSALASPLLRMAVCEAPGGGAPVGFGRLADDGHVAHLGLRERLVHLCGELAVGAVGRVGALGVSSLEPAVQGGGMDAGEEGGR